MIVGVPREAVPGERRVALTADAVPKLAAAGLDVAVERGAGTAAGVGDDAYLSHGARLVDDALAMADLVLKVQPPTAVEVTRIRETRAIVAFLRPLSDAPGIAALRDRRLTAFAMELVPRTTRAQPMDALSSQANLAGYAAAILAARLLPKAFPMLMTAAGTVAPARCLVIGAGVAGLQAIATARRLGAVVTAYDVRPAAKEQIASLGARALELALEVAGAEGAGGYAEAQPEELYELQRRSLEDHVAQADVVITTAQVPGSRAPKLVSARAIERMRPGSVVVDLAAEGGGNCELSEPGSTTIRHGVTIAAPANLPAEIAGTASHLYARNVASFVLELVGTGFPDAERLGEIPRAALVTRAGAIVNDAARRLVEGS